MDEEFTLKLLIKDVAVIDTRDADVTSHVSDVLIAGTQVERVMSDISADDAEVLDGSGLYALPGLVNAHDHLYSHELRDPIPELGLSGMRTWLDLRSIPETVAVMVRNAQARLPSGIVVTRDLGANHGLNIDIATIFRNGIAVGPVVVAAGRPIVMTGGHVYTFGREADGPWACRTAVREQAKRGAAVIKIMASGGLSRFPEEDFGLSEFTEEELKAIVDESHRRGLPTCAHAFGTEAVHQAIEAGVDSIEHGVVIDRADLDVMANHNVGYVPTLSNMRRVAEISRQQSKITGSSHDRFRILTEGVIKPHAQTFTAALEAGVRIGVGTDSTGDYREELELMRSFGMSTEQVIRAATIHGAELSGVDAGAIETNKLGSVLLYEDDPRSDVSRLTDPDIVIHKGSILQSPESPTLLDRPRSH